jgi:hypothetical protein
VRNAEAQALAFYESSVERFQAQDSFKPSKDLGNEAITFYRKGLGALHNKHVEALNTLAGKDATPDQIREVGKEFTAKLKELQESTTSLSTSLKQAKIIESKVEETLTYLTQGVDGSKAVGASDKSVVFVSADAADKIADWVKAQTKKAGEELAAAKTAKDPAAISAATEKLATASEAVHKQLDDIATLLSKVNGGLDAEKNPKQDQKERILAKTTEAGVSDRSSFDKGLSDYVGLLKSEMESRIANMFTAKPDGSYDLSEGRKGLAVIDKYDDMLERAIERAKEGELTTDEVKHAVEKIHGMLRKELSPPPATPVRNRIDDIVDKTVAAKVKELAPQKPSLFSRLAKWWLNN